MNKTDEELAKVANQIEAFAEKISILTSKIDEIETILAKDFTAWSGREKNLYGTCEQDARKALREERKALREEKQELSKQKTILLEKAFSSGVCRMLPPHSIHMDVDSPLDSFDRSKLIAAIPIPGKYILHFFL